MRRIYDAETETRRDETFKTTSDVQAVTIVIRAYTTSTV